MACYRGCKNETQGSKLALQRVNTAKVLRMSSSLQCRVVGVQGFNRYGGETAGPLALVQEHLNLGSFSKSSLHHHQYIQTPIIPLQSQFSYRFVRAPHSEVPCPLVPHRHAHSSVSACKDCLYVKLVDGWTQSLFHVKYVTQHLHPSNKARASFAVFKTGNLNPA